MDFILAGELQDLRGMPGRSILVLILSVSLALAAATGCRSAGTVRAPKSYAPSPAARVRTINDTELERVTRVMATDCVAHRWMKRFREARGRLPVIKVLPPLAESDVRFDPLLYQKRLEAELLRTGQLRIISAADLALSERSDQARYASARTIKVPGRSLRPDFVLVGSVLQERDDRQTSQLLTSVELIDLRTNEKVWIKTIKKVRSVMLAASSSPYSG
jgi:hypothetical protein